MSARAHYVERQVAVGPFGRRSEYVAADESRARRVVLMHELAAAWQRQCVETVTARCCERMPRDLKTAVGNLAAGNGLNSIATVIVAAADPTVGVPLASATKLSTFTSEWMQGHHYALAPDCWSPAALAEAHEAEQAANAACDLAQLRERSERSESALWSVVECGAQQIASTRRLCHVAKLEIQRRATARA